MKVAAGIMRGWAWAVLVVSGHIGLVACSGGEQEEGPIVPPPPPPAEYADKHMPAEWWSDQAKLEEGRKLYMGEANPDVNCASCHGKDGKPVKAGARDFRNVERMKLSSDSVWFWRIAEGVPNTKMKGWKSKLSEDDIWKLVLYERSFALPGKAWSEEKKQWVESGSVAAARTGES
ncbi:MAG: c-type cytochrome [Nitrospira sp.]|nr:c-type cytochrome [Nitrospira sp.]